MDELTELERLLLMAAAVHGLGPNTNLKYANSAKVVWQTLRWAGLVDNEVQSAWKEDSYCPAIIRCYGTLIRMAHQIHHVGPGRPPARSGEVLFEASGNLGTAEAPLAFPAFTSCRLTAHGLHFAEQLLRQHPECRKDT